MAEQIKTKKSRKIPFSWIINAILFVIILLCLICFFADNEIKIVKKNNDKNNNNISQYNPEAVAKKQPVPEALVTTKVKVRVNGEEVSNTKSVARVRLDGKSKPVIVSSDKNQAHNLSKKEFDNVEFSNESFRIAKKNSDDCCSAKKVVLQKKSQALNGDIVVSRNAFQSLSNRDVINGNLYLEDMHSYKLPCGVHVNGNLIVRNVRQLKFCGGFDVAGNIYVSKGTGFGALPENSNIKGQIIM